ncbi:MAG: hypothetical protein LIO46_06975 [Clostridiales bacterium]|nr:hypothetical protein [Clostridiales bacterium]
MLELSKYRGELYHAEIKEAYLTQLCESYSEMSQMAVCNEFRKIGKLETLLDKDVAFFSDGEFLPLFEEHAWHTQNVVNNKKGLIRSYMRWYRKRGLPSWERVDIVNTLDTIQHERLAGAQVYRAYWFCEFQELQQALDLALSEYSGIDVREHDVSLALVYLAWFGISIEEALELRKQDLSDTQDIICLPGGVQVPIGEAVMQFLRAYRDCGSYQSGIFGHDATVHYKESPYLIRSIKAAKVSKESAYRALSVFSNLLEEAGSSRRLKYHKIYLSGIYRRLIAYESTHGTVTRKDVAVFETVFRADYSSSVTQRNKFYNKFNDFQKYKQYYKTR